jgi:trehalose/maltose transport system substrate-binding protein
VFAAKTLARSALAGVAVLILGGCAAGNDAGDSGGKVTIGWLTTASSTSVIQDLAHAYEASHPNVSIEISTKTTDTDTNRANIINAISGGSSTPDVYMADVVWTAQFADNLLLGDLTDELPPELLQTIDPEVLKIGQSDGRQYCVPFFTDAGVLYYRKDLLEEAGLPVPATWDELAATSKKLQQSAGVQYGLVYRGAPYEGTTVFWTEMIADAGGASVNEDYSKGAVDSEAGARALTFLRSTIDEGISPEAVTTFKEPEALSVFNNGDSVFMASNAYSYAASQDASKSRIVGNVGIAPMPTFAGSDAPGASGSGGSTLCVNPNTEHLDETVDFIEFLLGEEAQRTVTEVGKWIPVNQKVQSDPEMIKLNPVLGLIPQLRIVNRPAGTAEYAGVSRAIFTNVNAVLAGIAPPEDALREMQGQIDSALRGS